MDNQASMLKFDNTLFYMLGTNLSLNSIGRLKRTDQHSNEVLSQVFGSNIPDLQQVFNAAKAHNFTVGSVFENLKPLLVFNLLTNDGTYENYIDKFTEALAQKIAEAMKPGDDDPILKAQSAEIMRLFRNEAHFSFFEKHGLLEKLNKQFCDFNSNNSDKDSLCKFTNLMIVTVTKKLSEPLGHDLAKKIVDHLYKFHLDNFAHEMSVMLLEQPEGVEKILTNTKKPDTTYMFEDPVLYALEKLEGHITDSSYIRMNNRIADDMLQILKPKIIFENAYEFCLNRLAKQEISFDTLKDSKEFKMLEVLESKLSSHIPGHVPMKDRFESDFKKRQQN